MNDRFFACMDCKIYIDVGYRWAYWKLEDPGIVEMGKPVSADKVLSVTEYWNPPNDEQSYWLSKEVLPTVYDFLEQHKNHEILYGDDDEFEVIVVSENETYYQWLQVGYLADETSPRALVQKGFTTWEQVTAYISELKRDKIITIWWSFEEQRERCRETFEALVRSNNSDS